MTRKKRQYREGTRAARFLEIRDAILAKEQRMRPKAQGIYEMAIGPFLIVYAVPGALPGRPFNMQIWPAGVETGGQILQGHKVANVDWDQFDNVDILSFRSGEWERELLDLLSTPQSVKFLPRRR